MDKNLDCYLKGVISAYIELLEKGIRDICLPNIGFHSKEETNIVKKAADKRGFKTLLVKLTLQIRQGKQCASYQRIMYAPNAKGKAEKARTILQKIPKSKKTTKN